MRPRSRFQPLLEALEDRWCPATVKLIGGNLFVSNQKGDLTLTVKAGNAINVVDNVTNVTLPAGTAVFVTGTSGSNTILFDVDGRTYAGNVLIDGRGGSDEIEIFNGAEGAGALTGNVTVLGNTGSDLVSFNGGAIAVAGGDLDFFGNVIAVETSGDDVALLGAIVGGPTTQFFGNVQLVNYNDVELSIGDNPDVVAGNLTITTVSGELEVDTGTLLAIGGNLTITALFGDDTVTLSMEDTGVAPFPVAVGGNVIITLGSGDNALVSDPAALQTIDESLFFTVGGGDDSVTFNSSTNISGNLTLNMGDGDNDYTGLATGFIVSGNVSINAGSGTDDLSGFDAIIGGNVALSLGNGLNVFSPVLGMTFFANLSYLGGNGQNIVDLTGNPVLGDFSFRVGNGNKNTFLTDEVLAGNASFSLGNGKGNVVTFNDGATVGKLTFRAGNGGDRLQIFSDDGLFDVDLRFGNGNDFLQFGGVAASVTGFVDGGGGTNLLQGAGAVTFVSPFTIVNFI